MRRAPLLVALVLLAGCSAGRRVATPPGDLPAKFPNHTPEEIVAAVGAATRGVASFSAEADVETESPNGGQGFGSSLRGRLADSLTATARGPLGIEVGRALVTRDSFFVHDKLNDRLLLGAVGVARRYVPGEVSPEMLGRALLGLLAPDPGARWTVAAEENRYVLTRADENGQPRERWLVDPTMWRAVSVEELGTDGRVLTRRVYADFEPAGETRSAPLIPRHVVLTSPADRLTVTVEHRRVEVNPPGLRLRFEKPRGASRRVVR